MNREIKFRTVRLHFGDIVYGNLIVRMEDSHYEPTGNYYEHYYIQNNFFKDQEDQVISETIGQFIGQLDVNNKEIYEHDIVEFEYFSSKSLKTGVVKWSNETSAFYIERENSKFWFDNEVVRNLKVIGNTLKVYDRHFELK